ncbi:MAG TPA: DUF2878 family protein [Candidatus Competibacteraceae bacterium]|nr:DUF2878 family protein [Candidatus Competibacteraceae bacterium]
MPLLANIFAFYVGWFACVLGGANHLPWLGTAIALLLIVAHLWWTAQPVRELRLILLSGALGLVLDSLPVVLGWVSYPSGNVIAGLAPYWPNKSEAAMSRHLGFSSKSTASQAGIGSHSLLFA